LIDRRLLFVLYIICISSSAREVIILVIKSNLKFLFRKLILSLPSLSKKLFNIIKLSSILIFKINDKSFVRNIIKSGKNIISNTNSEEKKILAIVDKVLSK